MSTNHPAYDNALKLATTVGTNIRTLRKNKRALAQNLVLAVAVEGFRWKEAWEAAKKNAQFAKMEKPEQNGFNVMGTACRTIIDEWADLPEKTRKSFEAGELVFSTLASDIKAAAKAAAEAEKEAETPPASEEPKGEQNAAPEDVGVNLNVTALRTVIDLLGQDDFGSDETPFIADLLGAVDALRLRIAEAQTKAA
jgi:hypothetical protein